MPHALPNHLQLVWQWGWDNCLRFVVLALRLFAFIAFNEYAFIAFLGAAAAVAFIALFAFALANERLAIALAFKGDRPIVVWPNVPCASD